MVKLISNDNGGAMDMSYNVLRLKPKTKRSERTFPQFARSGL